MRKSINIKGEEASWWGSEETSGPGMVMVESAGVVSFLCPVPPPPQSLPFLLSHGSALPGLPYRNSLT